MKDMKVIKVNLTKEIVPLNGTFIDEQGYKRVFDGFKVDSFSGRRAYLTMISDGLRTSKIAKKMEFGGGDNEVYVKFGGQKVCIGTYCVG